MLKRLVPLVAAALLLAALVPAPPAQADRLYSYCDPFKSVFCQGLVSLYRMEEGQNASRTSETGSAPFVEPDGYDITASGVYKEGTASFPHSNSANQYLVLPKTTGIAGTSYTLSMFVYIDTLPSADTKKLQVLTVRKVNGAQGYPALEIVRSGANSTFRWTVQRADDASTVSVSVADNLVTGKWYHLVVGAYPNAAYTALYRHTLFMEVRNGTTAGARATANVDYSTRPSVGDLILGGWSNTSPVEYGAFKVDYFGVWSWPWTNADGTAFYNSGTVKTFPFVD
jgi:hypothetical protein